MEKVSKEKYEQLKEFILLVLDEISKEETTNIEIECKLDSDMKDLPPENGWRIRELTGKRTLELKIVYERGNNGNIKTKRV